MNKIQYLFLAFVSMPLVSHGAGGAPSDFKGLVGIIVDIMGTLVYLVFALTFIVLIWGIIKGWIIGGGDAENVESGKKVVYTGIIALVVMSSVWGILYLLQSSLFGG